MKKDSLIDFLGYVIVRVLSLILWCIPLRIALWVGKRFGDSAYILNSKRRSIAYANLKSAFPEKDISEIKKIAKSHYRNLGMNIVELFKLPIMGKRYLERHIVVDNDAGVKDALKKGHGVIFLTAHFGNWEIGSLAMSVKGYPMSVFAREQKYKRLNNLLNKYREMTGCKVVTKGFSVRDIIKTLNNNGIVAMLADQDAGPNGVFVNFLGRPASTAYGPVNFSLKTKAALFPVFIRRVAYDRHLLEIKEQIELVETGDKEKDLRTNLEKITDVFEAYIRNFPDQWLWSHKRWKTTPQRTILVLSDGKPGHLNQAMAVAEMAEDALAAVLKRRGIEQSPIIKIRTAELKFKNKLTRLLLDLSSIFAGKRCQGCLRGLRFCLKKETFEEIAKKYADMVISCGSSTVAANIFLKYENNARNIVIMKPGLGRTGKFDSVILPRHDAPNRLRPNELITDIAPNRITEGSIKEAVSRVGPRFYSGGGAKKGLGLLIGGDTKYFRLDKETIEKIADETVRIADEMDLDMFVSTSRRTPAAIDTYLKDRLGRNPRCKLLVIANENNIREAVPAIFGLASVMVISPDSISMISESVSSGRHTIVFNAGSQDKKHEKAVRALEEKGYIKISEPDNIYGNIKEILTNSPALKRPDDRENIIERLKGII